MIVTKVNPKILQDLLERDFLPIVFPVGFDDNFDSYNINADDAACAIAEAVHAENLHSFLILKVYIKTKMIRPL